MLVGPFSKNSVTDKPLVFCEAGGAAALSAFSMLSAQLAGVQLIAIDREPTALRFWSSIGATVYGDEANLPGDSSDYAVVPCDEFGRARDGHLHSPWVTAAGGIAFLHDKSTTHDRLTAAGPSYFHIPKRLPSAVHRPRRGAGSRGLHITGANDLVTEYVSAEAEYVIDFNTRTDQVCPRITHALKGGADTFITLIGAAHVRMAQLRRIVGEVAGTLGIDGVGNVQLLEDRAGRFWFVECSARLSGSSWVNAQAGHNLLTGEVNELLADFTERHFHTAAGGIAARNPNQ